MIKKTQFETVPVEKLKWCCDPTILGIKSTDDIEVSPDIIGQRRAVNALRLGLDIESRGYNLFVNGLSGTGRRTAVKSLLKETGRFKRIPDDKLYVNNFKNPDMPRLIRLPAGKGREFKKEMNEFIEFLKENIPAVFESEDFQQRKKDIVDNLKKNQSEIIKEFEEKIATEKFALVQMQVGTMTRPAIFPTIDDKPMNFSQLSALVKEDKLSEEDMAKIEKKHSELNDEMDEVFKEIRKIEKKGLEELKELNNEVVNPLVEYRINEIKDHFKCEKLVEYFEEVKESIIDNLDRFYKARDEKASLPDKTEYQESDSFIEYRVNLMVDNFGATQAPVIFEISPTYANLFGTVEVSPGKYGQGQTDFTKIKAGSILKADGGFLIVEALDLLIEPGVWPAFKRTLKNRKIEIQIYAPIYMISISGMKPEPIECDVKVAIVGDPYIYQLLYYQDPDFKKIFKLRADFDSVMDLNKQNVTDYANFIKWIVSDEELLGLNSKAIAAVVEYGVKLAGKQNKLSTQFNQVADILREANYWAQKENAEIVNEEHIEKAIEEKNNRSRLVEEKIQEMIDEGSIMIDTEESVVGQVNGLSVYDMGDYSFGKPSRITANAAVGSSGVINIEREAQLSGRIHNKGVLILSGYLRLKYAQDKPLAMSASLCFEQSYAGVEGDSASSTEIYALLSTLSGVPLRQDIAVTGSVNQKGEIQPIGGVNQKIEGFFTVCSKKGLTGTQGVMIPHQNVNELMLNKEVIEAVKEGKFQIYPVHTIDQGIEILTGIEAGRREKDGSYQQGTMNDRVNKKLEEYADNWKQYQMGNRENI
jgi:ATP-dependent Lon protease